MTKIFNNGMPKAQSCKLPHYQQKQQNQAKVQQDEAPASHTIGSSKDISIAKQRLGCCELTPLCF